MPRVLSLFGVDPKRIGGNEWFARELSAQLATHSWESILAFGAEPPPEVHDFLSLPNVTLHVVPSLGGGAVSAWRHIAAMLVRYSPDILHLHFLGALSPYPWLGRALGHSRVFYTDQGSYPEGFEGRRRAGWRRALSAVVNGPVDGFISVSNYNQRMALQSGLVPRAKSYVIYNSVPTVRRPPTSGLGASFRGRYGIPLDRVVVLQVSWLIPEKGIQDLLEAARVVLDDRQDVHFAFAGEGAYRSEFEALATRLGINDRVTWLGLIRAPLTEGLYDAADIVCQVSRWQEAFGWVIAEAMLCERPVIGTRVGGIPEVIEDHVTGFLVDRRSPGAVAQRILQLAHDEDLRTGMGWAGHLRCLNLFDLTTNVRRLISIYGVQREPKRVGTSVA